MVFEMLEKFHPTLVQLVAHKTKCKIETQAITMAGERIPITWILFDTFNLYYDDDLCNNSPNALNLRFHIFIRSGNNAIYFVVWSDSLNVSCWVRFTLFAWACKTNTFRNLLLTTSIFVCSNKTSCFCILLYTFIVFICKYCFPSIQAHVKIRTKCKSARGAKT